MKKSLLVEVSKAGQAVRSNAGGGAKRFKHGAGTVQKNGAEDWTGTTH